MADIIADNTTTNRNTTDHDGPLGHEHQRLFYLHDLTDYKVHHDDTDIRGWNVKLTSGEKIGKVENLVVDKAAQKVRYIEVTADTTFFSTYNRDDYYLDRDSDRVYGADHDSHFLIPIGMISLDHSDSDVHVNGMAADKIGSVPRYRRGSTLRPSYEVSTLDHYNRHGDEFAGEYDERRYRNYDEGSFRSLDDQFYTSGYFNDDRYYDRHSQAINSKGL